jgi:hypothetical protein
MVWYDAYIRPFPFREEIWDNWTSNHSTSIVSSIQNTSKARLAILWVGYGDVGFFGVRGEWMGIWEC